MKNNLLMLLSLLVLSTFAQKKDKTPSFPIPEGESGVIQLKNGNTFFMEITDKEGIKVMLFDTLRKKIISAKLATKLVGDKIGYHLYEGAYEISGDVAIFLTITSDRTPVLFRFVVDGKTGKLKSEEKLAAMEKIKAGAGYAMAFGGVDMPDFAIIKDPESDYYAVISYNSFAAETNDRIEVMHFSPEHKIINKTKYSSPKSNYKYVNYLSAYVNRDNYIIIATYAFSTDKTGGDEGRFYISQLSKGKSNFKQQELSYTDFYKNVDCTLLYNKTKKTLHMFLITQAKSMRKGIAYELHFQNINPTTLKVDKEFAPDFNKINDYYKGKMERKEDFRGIFRKVEQDKNGNLVLLFQKVTTETSKYGTKTYYGDASVLTLSPAGKTIGSAVFPVSIYGGLPVSYLSMIVSDNTYILFNNTVDNMNLPENKEAKMLRTEGPAVPVKYTYANSSVKKDYLFKTPKEKKGNPYCDFSISDFNENTKKCAVLYIEPEKEKACFVWVDLP